MSKEFTKELEELLNKHSMEQYSETPDYLLAEYLIRCLDAWNVVISKRGERVSQFVELEVKNPGFMAVMKDE